MVTAGKIYYSNKKSLQGRLFLLIPTIAGNMLKQNLVASFPARYLPTDYQVVFFSAFFALF